MEIRGLAEPDEAVGGLAVSIDTGNDGVSGTQYIDAFPFTRNTATREITFTESDNLAPLREEFEIGMEGEPVNYVTLSPSVRGNAVFACMGSGCSWFLADDGIYYPIADYIVTYTSGSLTFRFPTRQTWRLRAVIFPLLTGAGYTDAVRVVYGYEPTNVARMIQ